MVAISESEKKAISEKYPWVSIVRTMRQDSGRHHYYCTEDRGAMKLLRKLRTQNVLETHLPKKRH